MYSYFDTEAGHRFTQGTLPKLTEAIESLTAELKRYNDLKEAEKKEDENK